VELATRPEPPTCGRATGQGKSWRKFACPPEVFGQKPKTDIQGGEYNASIRWNRTGRNGPDDRRRTGMVQSV
jgi:hypothetical protein